MLCGKITEGKLQGFIQSAVNGLMGCLKTVVCNSDMADLPLSLHLFQKLEAMISFIGGQMALLHTVQEVEVKVLHAAPL